MKKIIALILLSISLWLTGCNFSLAADITPPPGAQAPAAALSEQSEQISSPLFPLVSPDPAAGKEIYAEKCAPCHGTLGLGDGERASGLPNPVTAIGTPEIARNASPAEWYSIVTNGNLERFMPPFASLNDRQRWDVVAYAFSLSEAAESIETGKTIYQENCAGCHGNNGGGDGAQAAGMSMPNFSDQEYMANRSTQKLFDLITNGAAPNMPAFGDQLAENDRWALANFLRSFTFSTNGTIAQATPETNAAAGTPIPAATQTDPMATPGLSTGDIFGQVSNASGGALPVGTEVMLHGFDDQQLVISQTTQIASDGAYRFENIDMPENRMFFTTLLHQGVTYGSNVGASAPGQAGIDLPVTVYDTTQDPTNLKVDRLHLFFEQVDNKTMRVAELLVMSNTGNKAITPGADGKPSVVFELPRGYQDLQFQDGELGGRFIPTDTGFGDTTTVYPGQGEYTILMAYTLPYNRKLQLSQKVNYPTDAVVILTPDNLKLKGANIQPAGTRDVDGAPFQMYNMTGLAAGDQLELSVSGGGLTLGTALGETTRMGLVIGLSALGLVLIVGGVWMYIRNRNQPEAIHDESVIEPGAMAETPEEIMDAILALDDLFRAGQIPEAAYLERRSELKAKLAEILNSSPEE